MDEYKDWRLQVVYADLLNGKTIVASIAIWSHRLLIDRALYAVLTWCGLDFRYDAKPIWRKSAST